MRFPIWRSTRSKISAGTMNCAMAAPLNPIDNACGIGLYQINLVSRDQRKDAAGAQVEHDGNDGSGNQDRASDAAGKDCGIRPREWPRIRIRIVLQAPSCRKLFKLSGVNVGSVAASG